jgi:predicted nucleic acid-binding Zn ribbon protein
VSGSGDDEVRVGSVLRQALGEPKLQRGLTLGHLARRWDQVVGDKLASVTWPLSLDERALVVAAAGPAWASQARFLAEEIRRKAAEVAGAPNIREVRVVVRPDNAKPQVRKGERT